MPWILLAMETDADHAEILGDALLELGALSADIHDAAAGTEREQPLFGEPGQSGDAIWQACKLTALFDMNASIPAVVEAAAQAAGLSNPPPYRITYVEEQDWVRTTQFQFSPIRISSRLWVVPSWHKPPDPDAVNLILDPGLAFGTGSHPSTQLCLRWLDENLRGGEYVLDYGCGSGILAIAALKLGAARVVGIDIDPQAVEASRRNAILNQCCEADARFHMGRASAEGVEAAADLADVVIANILANPLIVMAPILNRATRTGGRIALSGILAEQAEDVIKAYEDGFDMHIARNEEDWVLLSGMRR